MANIYDIKSIDAMISFLKEKGGNHDYYYHYTTWDSLQKIMQNRSFLLTRGNSLNINDQHEAIMKGSWREWNKIYIGSFAFGSSENMAMWGLYGLPWQDAVRISIPKDKMQKWINGIKNIQLFDDGKTEDFHDSSEISLNDMVYVSGLKGNNDLKLTHYGKHITVSETYPLYGIDTAEEMTGYIKNFAWQYENEVRIRVRLAHDTGYERISIPIPNDVIDAFVITTGPYFKWKNEDLFIRLINENRIIESGFKNLVHYKPLCSMCRHEVFKRK